MKFALLLVTVALVAGLANTNPLTKEVKEKRQLGLPRDPKVIYEDGNEFVDAILAELRENAILLGLDPMELPDALYDIEVTFLFIRYHGELYFTNGWLQNLSTIVRAGNAEVSEVGTILDIKTYVTFSQLLMTYDYLAHIMNVGPEGFVIGTVDDLLISVDLQVDLVTCESKLNSLFISDSGRLDIRLDGTWFFDVIWNVILDMFTWMFKNVILQIIENQMIIAINTVLPTMDFQAITGVPCGPQVVNHHAINTLT